MKAIVTSLLLISTLISSGQDFKRFGYQIELGTNISIPYKWTIETLPNFERHPETDYRPGVGYFIEFLTSYNFNDRIFFLSGINYNRTLLNITDKIGLNESVGHIKTSYLTIPVLIKYRFSNTSPFSFELGPYFGFLVSAKEIGTTTIDTSGFREADPFFDSTNLIQDYNNDIKKNYTRLDFGLSGQVDYDFMLSDSLFGVLFTRFNYGLIDVITNDIYTNSSASKWKNYNFMVGVGLKF